MNACVRIKIERKMLEQIRQLVWNKWLSCNKIDMKFEQLCTTYCEKVLFSQKKLTISRIDNLYKKKTMIRGHWLVSASDRSTSRNSKNLVSVRGGLTKADSSRVLLLSRGDGTIDRSDCVYANKRPREPIRRERPGRGCISAAIDISR